LLPQPKTWRTALSDLALVAKTFALSSRKLPITGKLLEEKTPDRANRLGVFPFLAQSVRTGHNRSESFKYHL